MQSKPKKLEIPPELLKGLESIEAGAIPTLITRKLETFLTEQGLYTTSMTPEEAWQTLHRLAHDEQVNSLSPAESSPDSSSNPEKPAISPPVGGLQERFKRKKKRR